MDRVVVYIENIAVWANKYGFATVLLTTRGRNTSWFTWNARCRIFDVVLKKNMKRVHIIKSTYDLFCKVLDYEDRLKYQE